MCSTQDSRPVRMTPLSTQVVRLKCTKYECTSTYEVQGKRKQHTLALMPPLRAIDATHPCSQFQRTPGRVYKKFNNANAVSTPCGQICSAVMSMYSIESGSGIEVTGRDHLVGARRLPPLPRIGLLGRCIRSRTKACVPESEVFHRPKQRLSSI